MRKSIVRMPRQNNASQHEAGPLPWSYVIVIAVCGCLLGAGFFLAARQHFASMEFGMKNSALRKQVEDLESENRRLLLAREVSLSPAEITRTARSMGFLDSNTVPPAMTVNALSRIPAAAKPLTAVKTPAVDKTRPIVTMTAYQRPMNTALVETQAKKSTAEKISAPKLKVIKPELTAIVKGIRK